MERIFHGLMVVTLYGMAPRGIGNHSDDQITKSHFVIYKKNHKMAKQKDKSAF